MFHTQNAAEVWIPNGFNEGETSGEKTWWWVELALHIPYFYLSITISDGEDNSMRRHFLFSQLDDVLNAVKTANVVCDEVELGLFSPNHMNGSNFYMFTKIKEIWKHRHNETRKFVMDDGSIMIDSIGDEATTDGEYLLVISL